MPVLPEIMEKQNMGLYEIKSTSKHSAECNPIILRQTSTTRLSGKVSERDDKSSQMSGKFPRMSTKVLG